MYERCKARLGILTNSRTTAPLRYYIYDAIGPRDVNDNDDDEPRRSADSEGYSLETRTMGIPCRTGKAQ